MTSYSFRFQNNRSSKYAVFGFLTSCLLVACILYLDFVNVAVLLAAVFIPLIAGFTLLIKRGKAADTITVDDTGFTSTYHGRVDFEDIAVISGFGLLGAPPPSIKMKLKSGKKLIWYLSPQKSIYNSSEDAQLFMEFTDALSMRITEFEAGQKQAPPAQPGAAHVANTIPVAENYSDAPGLTEQLKEVSTRNKKKQWLAIPVGLAFSVLIFIRTCGTEYIQEKKDREITEIFTGVTERYQDNVVRSRQVLESYVKTLGPIYFYSNDHSATVHLLPHIPEAPLSHAIPVLGQASTNKHLEHFIEHPDSAEFKTVIQTENGDLRVMEKSILNYGDSTNRMLYLRFYDPHKKVNPHPYQRQSEVDSSTFVAFDMTTAVLITNNRPAAENLEQATLNLRMMLAQAQHSPTFKIYLSGAEKDSISAEIFDAHALELKKQLHNVGVDTSQFLRSVHNR